VITLEPVAKLGLVFLDCELKSYGSRDGKNWKVQRINLIEKYCKSNLEDHTRIGMKFHQKAKEKPGSPKGFPGF
jgi:hypothetical protein